MTNRPKTLAILCSLSFLYSVYGIITSLSSALSPPEVSEEFLQTLYDQINKYPLPIEGIGDQVESYYRNLMLNFGNYGAANFMFYGIELVGVFLMYRLNRIGFTLYMLSQIGLAATPVLFGSFNTFGLITLGITAVWNAIWVVLYAFQRKHFIK